jgi:hypothetical protein
LPRPERNRASGAAIATCWGPEASEVALSNGNEFDLIFQCHALFLQEAHDLEMPTTTTSIPSGTPSRIM